MAAGGAVSARVGVHLHRRPCHDRHGQRDAAHLLFRLCVYGAAVRRPEHVSGARRREAGDLLFAVAQGGHCGAADAAAAVDGARGQGRLLGGADLELPRRHGVLCDDVSDAVPEAGIEIVYSCLK